MKTDMQELDITPEMMEAGYARFHKWMLRWDYLADGLPGDEDVAELIGSIFSAMTASNPVSSR